MGHRADRAAAPADLTVTATALPAGAATAITASGNGTTTTEAKAQAAAALLTALPLVTDRGKPGCDGLGWDLARVSDAGDLRPHDGSTRCPVSADLCGVRAGRGRRARQTGVPWCRPRVARALWQVVVAGETLPEHRLSYQDTAPLIRPQSGHDGQRPLAALGNESRKPRLG